MVDPLAASRTPLPLPARGIALKWIELSPGFACNCRCSGCFSCSADPDSQMEWDEVQRWVLSGRRRGARHIWLSGGEPTIRKDFLRTVRLAQQVGYQRIKVQTNGMMFAYPGFAERALAAGLNEANLLLKSLDARVHDGLNRTPGSFELLAKGIDGLRAASEASGRPIRLEGDILMTSRNYRELPELVDHYGALGFRHFNVWLFSLVDQGDRDLRRLVPSLSAARPYLVEAFDRARERGITFASLNTPHCSVPADRWAMQFDPAGMQLYVVNPGGHAFMLEHSSIELGVYLPPCEQCAVRSHCHGIRQDYLDVHGAAEIRAVSAAEAEGRDPVGTVLDL
ncbi:MAG: hypothetical protein RIT45_4213 [Pseudomonadota bacterium]